MGPEPQTPASAFRRRAPDLLMLVAVAALALKASYGVPALRDAELSDEACYLIAGRAIPERGLPPAEYAPLYSAWYALLGVPGGEPMDLPGWNWAVLTFLLAGSVLLLVRALGSGRGTALLAVGV